MRRTLSKSSKRVKQTNLRMPEDLRLRVMREADKNRVSFNREVLNRLHLSFDSDTKRTIADVTNGLAIASARLLHDLHRQADLVRRVESLLAQLDQSPGDSEATKAVPQSGFIPDEPAAPPEIGAALIESLKEAPPDIRAALIESLKEADLPERKKKPDAA